MSSRSDRDRDRRREQERPEERRRPEERDGRRADREPPVPKPAPRGSSLNEFFINGEGIHREVMQREICKYLGSDAFSKPGTYNVCSFRGILATIQN